MGGHRRDPNVYFRVSSKDEVGAWGQRGELLPSDRTDGSTLPEDRTYFWKTWPTARKYARHLYQERKIATGFTLYDDLVIVGIRMDRKVVVEDPEPSETIAKIGESLFTLHPIPWSSVLSTEVLV